MSKYSIEGSTLSAIGDAIRDKSGTSDMISPEDEQRHSHCQSRQGFAELDAGHL